MRTTVPFGCTKNRRRNCALRVLRLRPSRRSEQRVATVHGVPGTDGTRLRTDARWPNDKFERVEAARQMAIENS
jgi:hypothetical protein